jgi:hypothetical protein
MFENFGGPGPRVVGTLTNQGGKEAKETQSHGVSGSLEVRGRGHRWQVRLVSMVHRWKWRIADHLRFWTNLCSIMFNPQPGKPRAEPCTLQSCEQKGDEHQGTRNKVIVRYCWWMLVPHFIGQHELKCLLFGIRYIGQFEPISESRVCGPKFVCRL